MSSALKKFLLLITSMLLISASSFAGVITFDNLSGNGGMIPEGYAGLNWANFGYMNADVAGVRTSDSEGMISAPNVAFSIPGSPNTSISSTAAFTLNSAWLTSAMFNDQPMIISGLLNGVKIDSMNVVLSANEPLHVIFNWSGINQVVFSMSNAPVPSSVSPISGGGVGFILDNLAVNSVKNSTVPEPMSLLLLGSGLGMAFTSWKRRRT